METIGNIHVILATIAALIAIATALARVVQAIKRRNIRIILRDVLFWIAIVLAVCLGVLAICLWKSVPCEDPSQYGFEEGQMGFMPQTWETDQGVTAVEQSDDQAKVCKHSLKMTADLEGGHPNRSKGEAYVEIPVQNLLSKPITVWVYVPKEAVGDPQIPNGIQVFVKDNEWRAEYGTWWNITPARVDSWQPVTLVPDTSRPPDGYMEPGFAPTLVRAVGVKVAIGEGSTAKYSGPIYIDAIDWP